MKRQIKPSPIHAVGALIALLILGMTLSTPLVAEEAGPVAKLQALLEANHVTVLDPKQEYVEGREPVLMGFNLSSAAHPFTPRNSPEIFNRGDSDWHSMFWDSRCYQREDGKFVVNQARLTKTENYYQVVMPDIVENVLAAQAMMPVLSNTEMRGTKGEMDSAGVHNEVGEVLGQNEEEIWAALVQRLMNVEAYRKMFKAAYPDLAQDEIHFAHAANAIAAFEIDSFSFYDSPFDRFLADENDALNEAQIRGALLFYGKANCVSCHSGKLLTDQKHYNMGVVPIGPGPNEQEDYDLLIGNCFFKVLFRGVGPAGFEEVQPPMEA